MNNYTRVDRCLITGIPLRERPQYIQRNQKEGYWYSFDVLGKEYRLLLCESLFSNLIDTDSALSQAMQENRVNIVASLLHEEFASIQGKMIHLECEVSSLKEHVNIKPVLDSLLARKAPVTRQEKYDYLVQSLAKEQKFDGDKIQLIDDIGYYGRLYFESFEEMKFFLAEMQRKGIVINSEANSHYTQFTFTGLEYIEILNNPRLPSPMRPAETEYEIALSFAGENRAYVERVADALTRLGITVFYDRYEQAVLWGKDLYQHLNEVYKSKCKYCIIFISKAYSEKLWTRHELKSAQTRAFKENEEYILPVRFDDTDIPGMNSTVGYIDGTVISPEDLAELAAKKIKG